MAYTETIKALECLCGEEIFCRECKYSGYIYYPECRQQGAKDAINLINRLKAENKNCGEKILNQREQLKATNEKIKQLNVELKDAKVQAEEYKQRLTSLLKTYEACQRDAVKEFAEKLLKKKYQSSDWSHGEHPFVVEVDDILETLEEMGVMV